MIHSSHQQPKPSSSLIVFLNEKLGISQNSINMGIKQSQIEQAPLPIILWSFGLLNLEQYQQVLDWEEDHL